MSRAEDRAAAQPRHLPARHPAVPDQGADPRRRAAVRRVPHRRGLRADVRARQGRAARAGHPARDRQPTAPVRGRGRLPDRPRRLRAARGRASSRTSWPCSAWPSRVWQQATLAGAGRARAAQAKAPAWSPTRRRWSGIEPRVRTSEPAFEPLYAAVRDRAAGALRLPRRPDRRASPSGTVEPWGDRVAGTAAGTSSGHDRDRDATRVFRLSRIAGRGAGGRAAPGDVVVPAERRHPRRRSPRSPGPAARRGRRCPGRGRRRRRPAPPGHAARRATAPTAGTSSTVAVRRRRGRWPRRSPGYGAGRGRRWSRRSCATPSCAGCSAVLGRRHEPARE